MIILLGTSGGGNDRHDRTAGNKHPGDSRAPLRIGNVFTPLSAKSPQQYFMDDEEHSHQNQGICL